MGGEAENCIDIQGHVICNPESVQHGEQKQRIVGKLPDLFTAFYQRLGTFDGGSRFRGSMSFDVHQRGDQGNLTLDLLLARGCRAWQRLDLAQGASELLDRLNQRTTRK